MTINLIPRQRRAIEAAWERAKAAGEQAGFGTWFADRAAEAILSGLAGQDAPKASVAEGVILTADTDRLAAVILETLLPELSDTLRRTAAQAMERVGKTTAASLGDALIGAFEASMPAVGEAAGEAAARAATLAILPEARRIAAAAELLTQPYETAPAGRGH